MPASATYYRTEGTCAKCPASVDPKLPPIQLLKKLFAADPLSAVFFFGFIVGLFFLNLATLQLARTAGKFGAISISWSYFQVASTCLAFNLNWPRKQSGTISLLKVFNLDTDFVRPECLFPSVAATGFYARWLATLLLPLVPVFFFGTFMLLLLLRNLFVETIGRIIRNVAGLHPEDLPPVSFDSVDSSATAKKPRRPLKVVLKEWIVNFVTVRTSSSRLKFYLRVSFNATLLFLSMAYINLSSRVLQAFDCTRQFDGSYTLDYQPSVVCFQFYNDLHPTTSEQIKAGIFHTHFMMVATALPFAVLYIIGIPLGLWGLLYYYRYTRDEPDTKNTIGFLYLRFESRWYFWELIIMLRKLVLVSAKLFFSSVPLLSALCAAFILFASIISQSYAKPYLLSANDRLETFLLADNFVLLFLGFLFFADKFPPPTSASVTSSWFNAATLSWFVYVSLGAGVLMIVYFGVQETRKKRQQRGIGPGGVLDRMKREAHEYVDEYFSRDYRFLVDEMVKYGDLYETSSFLKVFQSLHKFQNSLNDVHKSKMHSGISLLREERIKLMMEWMMQATDEENDRLRYVFHNLSALTMRKIAMHHAKEEKEKKRQAKVERRAAKTVGSKPSSATLSTPEKDRPWSPSGDAGGASRAEMNSYPSHTSDGDSGLGATPSARAQDLAFLRMVASMGQLSSSPSPSPSTSNSNTNTNTGTTSSSAWNPGPSPNSGTPSPTQSASVLNPYPPTSPSPPGQAVPPLSFSPSIGMAPPSSPTNGGALSPLPGAGRSLATAFSSSSSSIAALPRTGGSPSPRSSPIPTVVVSPSQMSSSQIMLPPSLAPRSVTSDPTNRSLSNRMSMSSLPQTGTEAERRNTYSGLTRAPGSPSYSTRVISPIPAAAPSPILQGITPSAAELAFLREKPSS